MIGIMPRPFETLFETAPRRTMSAGEILFYNGDPCVQVFLVDTGRVTLHRHSPSGARLNLHSAEAGQVIAEASVYSTTYHCDGVADLDARIAALPKADFLARLDADPALARAWAANLAHMLQQARSRSEIRGLRTVSERLDAWLSGGGQMPPHGEGQRLAETLGVSREALYREMARRR